MLTKIIEAYPNFGRCLRLENDHVELCVTLDVGPRVIHFARPGGDNVFYTDVNSELDSTNEELKEKYGSDAVYKFYGGHRLWRAPEEYLITYCPDNDPVEYVIDEKNNRVTFTPPPQPKTGLQMSMTITLNDQTGEVTVDHKIENVGKRKATVAAWAITQLKNGGVQILPQSKRETGFLWDRTLSIWPYTNMADPRVTWGDNAILLRGDSAIQRAFKLGTLNEKGWALYCTEEICYLKRFELPNRDLEYPDVNCNYETYTNHQFLEMECLGPVTQLAPQESTGLSETWSLYNYPLNFAWDDPEAALAFAAKIV